MLGSSLLSCDIVTLKVDITFVVFRPACEDCVPDLLFSIFFWWDLSFIALFLCKTFCSLLYTFNTFVIFFSYDTHLRSAFPERKYHCTLYSIKLFYKYAKQHGDCTALLIKENNTKVLYLILNCIVIAKHLLNNTPVIRQSRCWTEWLFIIIIIIKKMYLLKEKYSWKFWWRTGTSNLSWFGQYCILIGILLKTK